MSEIYRGAIAIRARAVETQKKNDHHDFHIVGLVIYFGYSIWNSNERLAKPDRFRYPSTPAEAQQGGRCRRTSSIMLCSESGCTHDLPHNLFDISKKSSVQNTEPTEITKLISEASI